MTQWGDLLQYIIDVMDERDCDHTLSYTKKFCKDNGLDFQHIRSSLDLLYESIGHICDCNICGNFDRFKNWRQDIMEKPDLELGIFWTNLFGFLSTKLAAQRHSTQPSMHCTGSFKFTKEFCAIHNLDLRAILSILRTANAHACDCEIIENSSRHFEDDALIGTRPTINLDDMNNPTWNV